MVGAVMGGLAGGASGLGGLAKTGAGLGAAASNPFSSMVKSYISNRVNQSPLGALVSGRNGMPQKTPPSPADISKFASSLGTTPPPAAPATTRPMPQEYAATGMSPETWAKMNAPTGAPAPAPKTTSTPAAAVKSSGMQAYRNAIASIESRGHADPYRAMGPTTRTGDRAYGKYQVMGNNIPSWTKEALGRQMTPREFLADDAAQDSVFDYKFGQSIQKYGSPEDAASVWFTGRPRGPSAGAAMDINKTSGNEYVRRFSQALGQGGGAPAVADSGPWAGLRAPTGPAMPQRQSPAERLQEFAENYKPRKAAPLEPASTDAAPPVDTAKRDALLAQAIARLNSGDTSGLRSLKPSDRLSALRKLAGASA